MTIHVGTEVSLDHQSLREKMERLHSEVFQIYV
jgi:hypothetical protein